MTRRSMLLGWIVAPLIACSPSRALDLPGASARVYAERGSRELRLYVMEPSGSEVARSGADVLLFHSGGWRNGTPLELVPLARRLLARGHRVALAEYRLLREPSVTVADCVQDACAAYDFFLRSTTDARTVSRRTILVGGASAGGHLAFWVAHARRHESTAPSGLVLVSGVIDTSSEGFGQHEIGASWRELSPLHNAVASLPPTLVLHGELDEVVRIERARLLAARLEELGVPCRFVAYPDSGHDFYVEEPPGSGAQTVAEAISEFAGKAAREGR